MTDPVSDIALTRQQRRLANSRFVELDALRGIAALSVVALHFSTEFDHFFPGRAPLHAGFGHGALGVQLFFLISGFVIFRTTSKYRDPKRFGLARVLRLYPTYWVCLSMTVLTSFVWPRYRQPLDIVVVNYTMLQSFLRVRDFDGVYWSLAREISFYVLIACLLWVGRGRISPRTVSVVVISWTSLGLALAAALYVTGSHMIDLLLRATAGEFAALFGAGMVLSQIRDGERRRSPALLGFLAITAGMTHLLVNRSWVDAAIIALVIFPLFYLVVLRPSTPVLRNRVIVWFGTISYPLYLLHQNIGHAVIYISAPHVGAWASRGLAFATVVALAWGVHEVVEDRLGRVLHRRLITSRRSAL